MSHVRAGEVNKTACQYLSKAKNYKTIHSNSPFQVSPGRCIINSIIAGGDVDTGTDNAAFVLQVEKEARNTEHILWRRVYGLPDLIKHSIINHSQGNHLSGVTATGCFIPG